MRESYGGDWEQKSIESHPRIENLHKIFLRVKAVKKINSLIRRSEWQNLYPPKKLRQIVSWRVKWAI